MSVETLRHQRRKRNVATKQWRECDSRDFECPHSESDRLKDEGAAPHEESPTLLRALRGPFDVDVDVGDNSAPAAGDRDTQALAVVEALQRRGSTEPWKVSFQSACLAQRTRRP